MNRWEVRKARTRRAIKDAAIRVFLDGDYLSTTVEQLIAAANVSRATFYSHFDNKLDLLTALIDDHIDHRAARYRALTELPDTNVAMITGWLDAMIVDGWSGNRSVSLFRLAVALDIRLMRRFTAARERYAQVLAPRFRGFDMNSGSAQEREDRRAAAHFFLLSMEQFFASLADESWVVDLSASKRYLARLLAAAA